MPTVNLYGDRKVSPTPLPGVRLTAAETPESLGAGLDLATARKDEAIAGFGGQVAGIGGALYAQHEQQARDQADLAVELQSSSELTAHTTQASIDTLNLKGQDASGPGADQIRADWNEKVDGIEATLRSDRQRQTFAKTRARAFDTLNELQLRHANTEGQIFIAQASDALVTNKGDEAVLHVENPRVAIQAIVEQMTAVRASGAALGQSQEVIKARLAATTTKTAHDLIMRALENDNVGAARAYYDHLGQGTPATADTPAKPGLDLIAGDTLGKIEKALLVGQAKSTGIREADTIIAAGGTLPEQLAKTKSLDDGPRVVAEQRIEHAHGLQQQQERQTTEATLSQAYDTLTKSGGDLSRIPASVQTQLAPHMPALRSYANTLSKGEKPETDWPTYYKRMMQASSADPTLRKAFSTFNLQAEQGKYAPAEFKQLVELQTSMRNGDFKAADAQVSDFREHHEQLHNALFQYTQTDPKDFSPAQKLSATELEVMVNQAISAQENKPGAKKASFVEVQGIINKILTPTTPVSPGSWWALNPFNSLHLRDIPAGGVFDKGLTDITPATRAVLEQGLRASGNAVNDVTVLNAYRNMLVRTTNK